MEQTLKELLEARKNQENKGITFIFGDKEEVYVSYKKLYHSALQLLYELQQAGFSQGDEVVFQLTDNQKFVYSFWACQLGGMIPVPVTTGNNDEHKIKLFKIWEILLKPRMITSSDFLLRLDNYALDNNLIDKFEQIKNLAFCYEEIKPSTFQGNTFDQKPEELAFIQFSSGSTGDPKGVMITHNNFFANVVAATKWMIMTENDVCLNWMPLTHDMGLIGTHLKSVYLNINQYNIHTNLFIRRPQLWMKKASEHKATLLYSPNFGYKYFLNYFKDKGDLNWDLSSVRMFYNGAEPIALDLCDEFLDKLAPYGLSKNTMHTVYGLAEGTIAVTFPPLNSETKRHILKRNHLNMGETIVPTSIDDNQAIVFADEGFPIDDCYVKICNEDGVDIGENKIGYIHIRGGNVTSGYYNNPTETNRVIDKDGWLNTSDLGFMQDGRLVITGRAKDIIFVNGQNYYSHDIERVAEECDGVDMGNVVVIGSFSEKSKRDELILFLLFKGTNQKFVPYVKKLKDYIYQRMEVRIDHVLPVKKIYKTTSGKVQRYKFRENYIAGEYVSIQEELDSLNLDLCENREITLPSTKTENNLLTIWKEIFEKENISIDDDFFSLGGDSLKVTQLISRIQETYQVAIEYKQLFSNSTIKSQGEFIDKLKTNEVNESHVLFKKYIKDDYPLSFAQQRMWFLDNLNNGSPQYKIFKGLLLQGELDIKLLEQSLNLIAKRHRILKMSFSEQRGVPIQIFNEDAYIKIDSTDLTEVPELEKENSSLAIVKEIVKKPFVLQEAPLIRAHVVKIKENDFILILCTHHILFDGWSLGLAIKELISNYENLQRDRNYTVSEAVYQYVDYTDWQSKMLTQTPLKNQLSYWKEQLNSVYSQINLPYDYQRPAIQTFHGDTLISKVSSELVEKVKYFSKRTKTTPFMVLLSAFQVLLYRYSFDREFTIGTSVANRSRKEMEDIIGFFTNNLVLRTKIIDNMSFEELLEETKRTTLQAFENQDVPFDKLVEELHITRDMSMNPLYQVMFTMQNTKMPDFAFDGIKGTYFSISSENARFDLAIDVQEMNNELELLYEYNTDLFNRDTISHMAANYNRVLENVLNNSIVLVDEVEVLTIDEKKEVLSSYKNTVKEFEVSTGIVELFQDQVKLYPGKIAVHCGDSSITYDELNKKANKLAIELKRKGIGNEDIVALYLDRSIELLIAILGVYKIGAAYMPMDPIFPATRLSYMLNDAKVQFVISQKEMLHTLPESEADIILLESILMSQECDFTDLDCKVSDNDLAYILYTSGSTGNPKGVQIEQGALVNFLLSMKEIIDMNGQDKWLAVTTISFDISILELLLPLISGATIVIAKREEVFDGHRLLELIKRESITIMQATPATWKLMLDAGFKANPKLKILCGGEALPKLLATKLVEGGNTLLNLYGPTETTIWSTYKEYKGAVDRITIGKPIANTSVYVLDSKLNPVPIGVPGELYIGGAGLARGYFNLPDLTKDKFVPNPFYGGIDTSIKIYRTGDIVKILNNGELEYLQRIDNQVKIRGFRIELEEIQTILSKHPLIKECVVAVKDIKQQDKIIAAYMILKDDVNKSDVKPEDVRVYLKEMLPEYMIPSAFVVMDAFPITLNKKVDIKSLPDPLENKIIITKDYEGATNHIETILIDIWKEVLNLGQVGIKDNFFDLGGYSMLLAQVKSNIYEKLNKDIPIIELFKYPTIESLAGFLVAGEEAAATVEIVHESTSSIADNHDIAIIGMSGRFPGAKNIDEFWDNLCNGKETICRFDKEEALENGANIEDVNKPEYVKAWGAIGDVDKFDGKFFGYNPKEATVLDPQQRIFLEEVWKAFEYAGYNPENYSGSIGVYASVGMNTYMDLLVKAGYSGSLANDYQMMTSNDKDFLATRVAYKFNLTGPSVTVQTACSSSLVALHHACVSLQNNHCDMAISGGVSIRMPEKKGYFYQEGMILSKDGHCRAFDEAASGTVGGNGAGVVVLKRYSEAVADRDNILAVIKGSAINNDGSQKIGYTAPSVQGQTKVIRKALSESGIAANQISYIEAHGTGTSLGDPIEISALTQAFGKIANEKQYCAIGSVKTNIGHLDAAAGITGLIKSVLTIKNRKIPPSLNYQKANKEIDFTNSPFYVNTDLQEYEKEEQFCVGVSSFGIGGTNAHVILQESPTLNTVEIKSKKEYLIPISARNSDALYRKCEELRDFILKSETISLEDMAYTLAIGRKEFEVRYCFIANSTKQVLDGLSSFITTYSKQEYKNELELLTQTINDITKYTLKEIANLWINGAKIDWNSFFVGETAKRIVLPVYPFKATSYWPKITKSNDNIGNRNKEETKEISDYYYAPVWEQSIEHITKSEDNFTIFILYEQEQPFISSFIQKIREDSNSVYICRKGEFFNQIADFEYELNMVTDWEKLFEQVFPLSKNNLLIIPMFGFDSKVNQTGYDFDENNEKGEYSYFSIISLTKAIADKAFSRQVYMKVITNGMQKVLEDRNTNVGLSLILGAMKVIPKEYNTIHCTSIDVEISELFEEDIKYYSTVLSEEVLSQSTEAIVAYRGQTRFVQTYKQIKLTSNGKLFNDITNNDVYVVTGGLGGIGLQIAEEMCNLGNPRMIFIQRNSFVKEEEWDTYCNLKEADPVVCEKINGLLHLKQLGANIEILQCDVSKIEEVEKIRKYILDKHGHVSGIIHVAGTSGGGMIQMKQIEAAKKAFAAKVKGTTNLYKVFRNDSLRNIILFSSLNAITGGFGQADYSAANAYMDAFAKAFNGKNGTRIISIDWERWPGVGMAKELHTKQNTTKHSLLGRLISELQSKWVFYRDFNPDNDWALSEHHVFQVPTVAGTTYLEMVRAAYEQITANKQGIIKDVVFLTPMSVPFGKTCKVITILEQQEGVFNFVVASSLEAEEHNWVEHVKGRIIPYNDDAFSSDKYESLNVLQQMEYQKTYKAEDLWGKNESTFIYFGERWKSLQWFKINDKDALAKITLKEEFSQDLEEFKLHPAMLDVATGALRFVNGGNYLPFNYQSIVLRRELEKEIYAHFKFHDVIDGVKDFITCDITIYNSNGDVLIEIINFAMRFVVNEVKLNSKDSQKVSEKYEDTWLLIDRSKNKKSNILTEGLTTKEGRKIFNQVLKYNHLAQIIISKKDVAEAILQADYLTNLPGINTGIRNNEEQEMHERPELNNAYAACRNEIEEKIRDIWEPLLAIKGIGIHDEFFELGGDSLLLIQLHTNLKESFDKDFPVVELYKYNTIASQAKLLTSETKESQQESFEQVNDRVNTQRSIMQQRRNQMQRMRGGNNESI